MEHQRIEIHLSVAYVTFGGNSGNAVNNYYHSFNKNNVVVSPSCDTHIGITLINNNQNGNSNRFEIYSFSVSDKAVLVGNIPEPDGNKVSIICKEGFAQMISHFIIMVRDTETGAMISCDPQVVNSQLPPP